MRKCAHADVCTCICSMHVCACPPMAKHAHTAHPWLIDINDIVAPPQRAHHILSQSVQSLESYSKRATCDTPQAARGKCCGIGDMNHDRSGTWQIGLSSREGACQSELGTALEIRTVQSVHGANWFGSGREY